MSAHARYYNYGGKYGRNGGQSQKPSVNCDRSVLTALPGGDNDHIFGLKTGSVFFAVKLQTGGVGTVGEFALLWVDLI